MQQTHLSSPIAHKQHLQFKVNNRIYFFLAYHLHTEASKVVFLTSNQPDYSAPKKQHPERGKCWSFGAVRDRFRHRIIAMWFESSAKANDSHTTQHHHQPAPTASSKADLSNESLPLLFLGPGAPPAVECEPSSKEEFPNNKQPKKLQRECKWKSLRFGVRSSSKAGGGLASNSPESCR